MAFQLGVICGGPSLERGISLNSARTLLDHFSGPNIHVRPFYIDRDLNPYALDAHQLYSNTPSDFDFKLKEVSQILDRESFIKELAECDLIFPCIHGEFGETGDLQALLESANLPFAGSSSASCKSFFLKHQAAVNLMQHGFRTIPCALLQEKNPQNLEIIERFFANHHLKQAIVKPTAGGSSIGVKSVVHPNQALEHAEWIFANKIDSQALLEPFIAGKEFTLMVLVDDNGMPFALIPTEITIAEEGEIFDYRRKYLPTCNTHYHTPAQFDSTILQKIRKEGEEVFKLFHMQDFARIDGWVLDSGEIVFTDINPITGMEQNSFLFRQASLLGLSHKNVLRHIAKSACKRYEIESLALNETDEKAKSFSKQPVHILMGGQTAERQVSLMSGTNIWLKLLESDLYEPILYFWGPSGNIWQIPYSFALNHTVEEVEENCLYAEKAEACIAELFESPPPFANLNFQQKKNLPKPITLEKFIKDSQKANAFIFIALHGGIGEDGTLQKLLDEAKLPYNGTQPLGSSICMDKYQTGLVLQDAAIEGLIPLPKISIDAKTLQHSIGHIEALWASLTEKLQAENLILKPRADGCSAGVIRLRSASELTQYLYFIGKGAPHIPAGVFNNQPQPIVLPSIPPSDYLFEPYIETDRLWIADRTLHHTPKTGWIELTVGVRETAGNYKSLTPSITIADGAVLSLEEKFQSGTGVNLTPPPESLLSTHQINKIKQIIEKVAFCLQIKNYARIDIFFNRITQELMVIEANTLPGMTASTVIYHQALAETPSQSPKIFLENIITTAWNSHLCTA